MSKVYETLKKKNDTSVEVYPNIERTNIPDGAINTAKLEDNAVTTSKITDSAVTTAKINNDAVTYEKVSNRIKKIIDINEDVFDEDGNIENDYTYTNHLRVRIDAEVDGDLDVNDKLFAHDDIEFDEIPVCNKITKYGIIVSDNDLDKYHSFIGYSACDLSNYNDADILSATDFDKSTISDWSQTEIDIVTEILSNIIIPQHQHFGTPTITLIGNDRRIELTNGTNFVRAIVYDTQNNQTIYQIQIDTTTKTITSYTYNGSEYFYIDLFEEKTML